MKLGWLERDRPGRGGDSEFVVVRDVERGGFLVFGDADPRRSSAPS
jgi:hypothetical protein